MKNNPSLLFLIALLCMYMFVAPAYSQEKPEPTPKLFYAPTLSNVDLLMHKLQDHPDLYFMMQPAYQKLQNRKRTSNIVLISSLIVGGGVVALGGSMRVNAELTDDSDAGAVSGIVLMVGAGIAATGTAIGLLIRPTRSNVNTFFNNYNQAYRKQHRKQSALYIQGPLQVGYQLTF
ncbi:MAG: hypothetical protein R3A45_07905 [Bdellovibrionota bacterium]